MLLDFIVSFLVLFWMVFFIASVMILGGGGRRSLQEEKKVYSEILFISYYPTYIFIFYLLMDWRFWGISPWYPLLIATLIISAFMSSVRKTWGGLRKGIREHGYSITSQGVFYNAQLITLADVSSFTCFNEEQGERSYDGSDLRYYAKDENNIYYQGRIVQGARPDSFRILSQEEQSYWRDDEDIYYAGELVEGAEVKHFKAIDKDSAYYHDGRQVYFHGQVVKGADVESFELLLSTYQDDLAKDAAHIYFDGLLQSHIDAASFELLCDDYLFYSRDKKHFYYKLEELDPRIDPLQVRIIDTKYAVTNIGVFYADTCSVAKITKAGLCLGNLKIGLNF